MSRPVDDIVLLFGNKPKRLHEIDIENLVGNGKPTRKQVQAVKENYGLAVQGLENDLVILAAGPQNRIAVMQGWPGAIYMFRKGKDGADAALVDFFNQIEDKTIFTDLFVASGDNRFSTIIHSATQKGIKTTLVIGTGEKSSRLNADCTIRLVGEVHNV